jgi:hypothetical protein
MNLKISWIEAGALVYQHWNDHRTDREEGKLSQDGMFSPDTTLRQIDNQPVENYYRFLFAFSPNLRLCLSRNGGGCLNGHPKRIGS